MNPKPQIRVTNKFHCDDPKAIYIGRGSPLGNPYTVEQYGRDEAIARYATWLNDRIRDQTPSVINALDQIVYASLEPGGVKLKCFCTPKRCHGDVIAALVLKTVKG